MKKLLIGLAILSSLNTYASTLLPGMYISDRYEEHKQIRNVYSPKEDYTLLIGVMGDKIGITGLSEYYSYVCADTKVNVCNASSENSYDGETQITIVSEEAFSIRFGGFSETYRLMD